MLLLQDQQGGAHGRNKDHGKAQDPLEPADAGGGGDQHQQKEDQRADDDALQHLLQTAEGIFLSAFLLFHGDSSDAVKFF